MDVNPEKVYEEQVAPCDGHAVVALYLQSSQVIAYYLTTEGQTKEEKQTAK